ncbi:hypothetical protein P5V15_011143 [Pogonomyrmex californicus]
MELLVVLAMLAYASANTLLSIYGEPTYELAAIENSAYDEVSENLPLLRNRRHIICGLPSWQSKKVNHNFCAAKCLAQRRRGGSCHDGICICRNSLTLESSSHPRLTRWYHGSRTRPLSRGINYVSER